jgi:hypothetical protein
MLVQIVRTDLMVRMSREIVRIDLGRIWAIWWRSVADGRMPDPMCDLDDRT